MHDPWRDWLAAALRGDRPAWNSDALGTIEDLVQSAENEGVAALVDAALHGADRTWTLPRALDEGFATAAREQIAVELMRRAELSRVIQSLAAANIPVLVLKGGALAYSIYPAAHLRPRIDIDVLVPDADAAERSKPALAALGYVASQVPTTAAIGYELILRREAPGGYVHWIDVHWALANQALYASVFGFDELSADAIALPALGKIADYSVYSLVYLSRNRSLWLSDPIIINVLQAYKVFFPGGRPVHERQHYAATGGSQVSHVLFREPDCSILTIAAPYAHGPLASRRNIRCYVFSSELWKSAILGKGLAYDDLVYLRINEIALVLALDAVRCLGFQLADLTGVTGLCLSHVADLAWLPIWALECRTSRT